MPAIIRCPKCDRMLSSQAQTEGWLSCPHCEGQIFVTAEQAAWPNPQLPGESDTPDTAAEEDFEVTGAHTRLGKAMPWLASLSINAAIILALTFVSLFTITEPRVIIPPRHVTRIDDNHKPMLPEAPEQPETKNDRPNRTPGGYHPVMSDMEVPKLTEMKGSEPLEMIGQAKAGMVTSTGNSFGPGGPGDGFFDGGGGGGGEKVANTVFVIDRSGSMESTFAIVRRELLKRIARMDARSKFHIVMFAGEAPIESPPGRLVKATEHNKDMVADFLDGIVAQGRTRPGPALEVAFRDLAGASDGGKQIYLLTDAAFPDDAAVLDVIGRHNPRRDVLISTILFGNKSPRAEVVLRRIATDNGGRFKFISWDELY